MWLDVMALVFEDLKEWAEMMRDMAWEASETQGRGMAAADAMEACRPERLRVGDRPAMSTLDVLGWEHPDLLAKIATARDNTLGDES